MYSCFECFTFCSIFGDLFTNESSILFFISSYIRGVHPSKVYSLRSKDISGEQPEDDSLSDLSELRQFIEVQIEKNSCNLTRLIVELQSQCESENVSEIFLDTDVQDSANTSVVTVIEIQHADNEWSNPKQKFKRKKTKNKNKLEKTAAVSGLAVDDVKAMSLPSKNETVIIGTGEPGDNASANESTNDFGPPAAGSGYM
ncbi:hypothetical protein HHI36_001786 [Cryptolaemus montrouzieri]|uniref:Uncharacterized protein n=1 Tax=Cryptolaemus montrouzieri TaxID=559131 RepID=A0ABD2P8M3_9CUCU